MGTNSVIDFYDKLSNDYDLIFSPWDWDNNISEQSKVLVNIIKKYSIKTKTILDCTCWIWTQAIGLAQKGYNVHATDISTEAINRAIIESKKRNTNITFYISDIRNLETEVKWIFDTVISCDNSLPHLLTNDDLFLAAKNILTKMKSGSLFICGIRDYDQILKSKTKNTIPNIKSFWEKRVISFQVWDWTENNIYTVNQFLIKGQNLNYNTFLIKTQYRAYQRFEITDIFEKAGFCNIKWLSQEESWYHQPLMIAFKK